MRPELAVIHNDVTHHSACQHCWKKAIQVLVTVRLLVRYHVPEDGAPQGWIRLSDPVRDRIILISFVVSACDVGQYAAFPLLCLEARSRCDCGAVQNGVDVADVGLQGPEFLLLAHGT